MSYTISLLPSLDQKSSSLSLLIYDDGVNSDTKTPAERPRENITSAVAPTDP